MIQLTKHTINYGKLSRVRNVLEVPRHQIIYTVDSSDGYVGGIIDGLARHGTAFLQFIHQIRHRRRALEQRNTVQQCQAGARSLRVAGPGFLHYQRRRDQREVPYATSRA